MHLESRFPIVCTIYLWFQEVAKMFGPIFFRILGISLRERHYNKTCESIIIANIIQVNECIEDEFRLEFRCDWSYKNRLISGPYARC